jgi:hypothetical protein
MYNYESSPTVADCTFAGNMRSAGTRPSSMAAGCTTATKATSR